MNAVNVTKGSQYTLPSCTFTAPVGKVFNGWDKGAVGSKITVNANTTLTAQWKAIECTVSFAANGGSGTMNAVKVNYGSSYSLPACTFTAPIGKAFNCWDKCAAGTSITVTSNITLKAQWKAMPNYLTKPVNAVVMADVSGSMRGRPMATSIGLATYFAQHNTGHYHNQYLTFTSEPEFINIREGASLLECVKKVAEAGVGYSTNLEKAFMAILETAVNYRVPNNEMPKALVVISDMEIDKYMRPGRHWDFLDVMRKRFAYYGYKLPKIVMWNVNARKDTVLSQSEDVIFISGQSTSSFKSLCQNLDGITAYDLMLQVLNGKAYEKVRV
jgi:hypothetical protein